MPGQVGDFLDAVHSGCLQTVACTVEQRRFDTGDAGESSVALHFARQVGPIDLGE